MAEPKKDSIICRDSEDAKQMIDNISGKYIEDWEFLEGGGVEIHLNCKLEDICKE